MFTGLVEGIGLIRRAERHGSAARLAIACDYDTFELGESIAVDGCCLTVAAFAPGSFEADASEETLRRTTLGAAKPGSKVNLERAVRPQDRLGGHLVTGHVDQLGRVRERTPMGGAVKLVIDLDPSLARFVAEKGSITVNGVSLTVNGVSAPGQSSAWFDVAIIPHTQEKTTLHELGVGAAVNLEVDLVARYVARLAGFAAAPPVPAGASLESLLATHGFGAPSS